MAELESLSFHVGHIKQIVATQQNYAKVSGLIENVCLSEMVEDALRIFIPQRERSPAGTSPRWEGWETFPWQSESARCWVELLKDTQIVAVTPSGVPSARLVEVTGRPILVSVPLRKPRTL
jgi:hypothetical protein